MVIHSIVVVNRQSAQAAIDMPVDSVAPIGSREALP